MAKQLKEEIEQLRKKLTTMETTQKESAKQKHHPVYIKQKRKFQSWLDDQQQIAIQKLITG